MTATEDYNPHLFEGEYELLYKEMSKATSYLEYGTGGSTLLAAECGMRLIVSVDSDATWLRKVAERIANKRTSVDIELIHCDIGPTGEWGFPLDREQITNW